MQTQTVQNSPLLSGNTASGRSSNAAQGDQQFAQALNHQIERQAVPPAPLPPAAAPRRAEPPKPAQPQVQASQQANRAPGAQAPASKPATPSQAAAKNPQNKQAAQANEAQNAGADGATAEASASNAGASGARTADDATAADSAAAADQSDDKQASGDAVAEMLAMLQGYAQPAATDAAAAAGQDSRAAGATLPGDAVLDGKSGKSGIANGLSADGLPVDQASLLAAKAAADGSASKSAEGEQDARDALAKLGHGAATDTSGSDKAAAKPGADFQSALQQASADASKAAELAARDAKPASQPQAGALQAAAAALAPAGAANAQAAQSVASNQLHARVGSQGWDQQLGQKVIWMVNGGEQSATLTLNPPDLGPLQVVLSVSNDQASVAFTAAQPEVRQALEQALPKLRETMGEAGITLGNTSVSSGSQEQQQAFAEMASGGRGRGVVNGQNGNDGDSDAGVQPAPQRRRSVLGAVDTFA